MSDESTSLSSGNLVENSYKLALKFFMNKNFEKSFDILKNQYHQGFKQLTAGVINELLFMKILNLYLTEVGLILQSNHEFKVSKLEKQQLIHDLKQDTILTRLLEVYEGFDKIPLEILYNLYLINYIGLDLPLVYKKLMQIYPNLNFYKGDDKFLRKLVELLAIKILPEMELLDDAKQLVKENPLLRDKSFYLDKINQIETDKLKQQEHQQHLKQKQIREQAQQEKKNKMDKDLKYKSLKQIKQAKAGENGDDVKDQTAPTNNNTDLNALRDKLLYNFTITRKWLQKNSPLLLLAIIVMFIGRRVLKARNVNVMNNLKETLGMAFKISYL